MIWAFIWALSGSKSTGLQICMGFLVQFCFIVPTYGLPDPVPSFVLFACLRKEQHVFTSGPNKERFHMGKGRARKVGYIIAKLGHSMHTQTIWWTGSQEPRVAEHSNATKMVVETLLRSKFLVDVSGNCLHLEYSLFDPCIEYYHQVAGSGHHLLWYGKHEPRRRLKYFLCYCCLTSS